MATRRFGTLVKALKDEPETAPELVERLDDETLSHLGAAVLEEQRRRAVDCGDRDAIMAAAFEQGFGRDGLGVRPWIEGPYVVCPGGLIGKNRGNHKCRFVSVNDSWVWESHELIDEEKRSLPGASEGFRAIALIPIVEGTELDVVSGKMRQGQHSVERVVSLVIRRGELVEVSQRDVKTHGLR